MVMPNTNYDDSVQYVLRGLVRDGTLSLPFEDVLHRVLVHRNGASLAASPEERGLVLLIIESEVQAHQIVINEVQLVSLSAVGVAYYGHQRNDLSAPDMRGKPQTKQQARDEYIRAAGIMTNVMQALEQCQPAVLVRDIRNVPALLSETFDSMSYMQALNDDVLERINQTANGITYLERLGYGANAPAADMDVAAGSGVEAIVDASMGTGTGVGAGAGGAATRADVDAAAGAATA
ncbi:hypothetical protein C8Q70DRAFT_1055416 [Cubamyces menziesii]|nr:hypothetical protein C8Q70DRAFT_1055416 [Cubamyces menziesii]